MFDLSSKPPAGFLEPLQKLDAVQLVGLPVVVQVSLVDPGYTNGPEGIAVSHTEIALTGFTVTIIGFENSLTSV